MAINYDKDISTPLLDFKKELKDYKNGFNYAIYEKELKDFVTANLAFKDENESWDFRKKIDSFKLSTEYALTELDEAVNDVASKLLRDGWHIDAIEFDHAGVYYVEKHINVDPFISINEVPTNFWRYSVAGVNVCATYADSSKHQIGIKDIVNLETSFSDVNINIGFRGRDDEDHSILDSDNINPYIDYEKLNVFLDEFRYFRSQKNELNKESGGLGR